MLPTAILLEMMTVVPLVIRVLMICTQNTMHFMRIIHLVYYGARSRNPQQADCAVTSILSAAVMMCTTMNYCQLFHQRAIAPYSVYYYNRFCG